MMEEEKMKKAVYLITSLMISAAIITGCGSNKTANKQGNSNQSDFTENKGNNQNNRAPGITGEVTAVDGNKVTLKLIQMPARGTNNREQSASSDKQNNNQGNKSQRQAAPSTDAQAGASEQAGQQKGQGMPSTGQVQNSAPNFQTQYTGETKIIEIPDGTQISTFNKGSQEGASSSLSIKDIKVGDRLTVSYTDSKQSAISRISIMNFNQDREQKQS